MGQPVSGGYLLSLIHISPTKLMKQLGYGKDYKYAHAYQGNFVQQQFLPDEVKDLSLIHI